MTSPIEPPAPRRDELVAAAASGDLTADEQRELEALAATDPTVAEDVATMQDLLGRIDRVDSWAEPGPSPAVDAHVAALGTEPTTKSRRRPRWQLAVAAAALVAVGAGGTLGLQQVGGGPVQGPPGTLGAQEAVSFAASDGSGDVQAQVVAHTWGTEADLEVTGLEPGRVYEVFFVDREGREVSAGAFLGSKVTIDCQMNAAVMREDVTGLRITTDDGTTVREAELPAATT